MKYLFNFKEIIFEKDFPKWNSLP